MTHPQIEHLFHKDTGTITYIVYDKASRDGVIIDPVLDFDPRNSVASFTFLKAIVEKCNALNLKIMAVLDTHFHADHISGTFYLKNALHVDAIISEGFLQCQRYFSDHYNVPISFAPPYEKLLKHNDHLELGTLSLTALSLKGHTPSCMGYLIGDAIFVGDAVFIPERGCGRVDFPGGSAKDLFDNIHHHLFALPDEVRVFVGHDYPSEGKNEAFETSVKDTRIKNIMLNEAYTQQEFIAKRSAKDQTLGLPRLFYYSTQANINGGDLPRMFDNKPSFVVPVNISPFEGEEVFSTF